MPKTSVDALLQALETIKILQDAVRKHDQAIAAIADKLDDLSRRVERLESA